MLIGEAMKELFGRLTQTEPAMLFLAIRAVVYIAVGATGAWLSPEAVEPILGTLAMLLGVDAVTTNETRKRVSSPATAAELVSGVFVGKVGDFIKGVVERAVPQNKLTRALAAVTPVLAEYAQSNLNDDDRMAIQTKVHRLLRSARLLKSQSVGPVSLLSILVVGVVLAGCAPFQDIAGGAIDRAAGDDAQFVVVETGLEFQPGDAAAEGVLLSIMGTVLDVTDERCSVLDQHNDVYEATCDLGDVNEPTVVEMTGQEVTALASYRRAGAARVYLITLD